MATSARRPAELAGRLGIKVKQSYASDGFRVVLGERPALKEHGVDRMNAAEADKSEKVLMEFAGLCSHEKVLAGGRRMAPAQRCSLLRGSESDNKAP